MGEFANTVQEYLREELSNHWSTLSWEIEYQIAGTPVDVGGQGSEKLVLLELEWRRADPADNAAKLFRHLDTGSIEAETIEVFHVFTNYSALHVYIQPSEPSEWRKRWSISSINPSRSRSGCSRTHENML